ncbi:MAG: cobalt ECF transporter T component CbiQ [Planctomycetes bacterium]|nr:cobalt ECF transporter T component CbiQ [Planctomycetota bacterium]
MPGEPPAAASPPATSTSPPSAPDSPPRRRPARDFLGRTLEEIRDFLEQAVFAEGIAAHPGLLQGFDARAKLVFGLGLATALALATHPAVPAAALLAALPVAAASALPLGLFWARLWPVTLGFTAVMALPAAFNVFRPGPELVRLWSCADGSGISLTRPGVLAALGLALRVCAIASWTSALALTTRRDRALDALRALGVPAAFRLVGLLAYRYLVLLCDLARAEHLARTSRTVRRRDADDRGWLAGRAGALLLRANAAGEAVHHAMTARGAGMDVRTPAPPPWRARDAALACAGVAAAVAVAACGGLRP